MAPPLSISEQKEQFLLSQIRLLSTLLAPSREWQQRHAQDADGLSSSSILRALQQANLAARRHQQLCYSSQATQHVAAQIESLYWQQAAGPGVEGAAGAVVPRGADLLDPEVLEGLPLVWVGEQRGGGEDGNGDDGEETEGQRRRYVDLRERLVELHEQLEAEKQKNERYSALLRLLDGFRDPSVNVQPNLLARDCEVGKELDRMRILMARAGAKLEGVKTTHPVLHPEEIMEMPTERDRRRMKEMIEKDFG